MLVSTRSSLISAHGPCGRAAAFALALASSAVWAGPAVCPDDGPALLLAAASYNVQFATPDVPILAHLLRELPGHKPNVEARARAIGAALACFDVIGLQETINDQRRAELLAQLEASGRDCGRPSRLPSGRMFDVVDGPDIPDEVGWLPLVDDELALASRLPIVAVGARVFAATAGTDGLAAKGVLHARLARGDGADAVLDVFVTHLQANADQAEVRQAQVAELATFIRERAAHRATILVMGDFNLRGGDPDRADPGSEYNSLLRALNEAVAPDRFADLWLATHPDDPETDSGTKPRVLEDGSLRPREKRVDFMFLAGNGHMTPRAMRRDFFPSELVVDGEPVGHLSNHAALLAEIDWNRSVCPLLSASSAPR